MEQIYNKLVRDKIPNIIKENGEIPVVRVLDEIEYKIELERKLHEEYQEVIESSGDDRVEELADMLEVIKALAKLENKDLNDVIAVANKKVKKRGAFDDKIYLVKVIESEKEKIINIIVFLKKEKKMQKFQDLKYERISLNKTQKQIEKLILILTKSSNYSAYLKIVKKINALQTHIEEMADYADICNMRDMNDEYWKSEIAFWNVNKAKFDILFVPYYQELLNSSFKDKLTLSLPDNFFRIIAFQIKTSNFNNVDLIKKENELKYQYRNLNRKEVLYNGKLITIGALSGLFTSKNRKERKQAHDIINNFYYENKDAYQKILFDLINIRNIIAKNSGFVNYADYSLYKLKRFEYNYCDIRKFRNNIIKYIVPLCQKMSKWQQEELNLSELTYYDTVFFTEMPVLKKTETSLLINLKNSFQTVDSDLGNLYNSMLENGYIDLLPSSSKVNFSITNYLTETEVPVITGNYKNTYLDLQTTTHEMGHAFQKYCASLKDKNYVVSPLLKYPTMEIAEMFSYAMELIMSNRVKNVFDKENYQKYSFIKIYNFVSALPYICAVDEFQEIIYSKKDLVITDINKIWLLVVQKYHLEKNNNGHVNLKDGGYYYRQNHIFLDPFYYIDYALSYVGALLIWQKSDENLDFFKEVGAVASYYSFIDLIDKYNMPNPFSETVIKNISTILEKELVKRKVKNMKR